MNTLLQKTSIVLDTEFLYSEDYVRARRRVFKQLIQALLYENTINFREHALAVKRTEFTIRGQSISGGPVTYRCTGYRRASFGRVELSVDPVMRICNDDITEALSIREFLTEISSSFTIVVEFLERFIQELEHTLVNDALASFYASQQYLQSTSHGFSKLMRHMAYDDIESNLIKAHPYHPCYKSRMGFDVIDNIHFGPEFLPELKLIWLAVRKSNCLSVASPSLIDGEFYQQQLGAQLAQFVAALTTHHANPDDYLLMPIHPWQWLNQLLPLYSADIHAKNIILLGEGNNAYRPQQSIRTLTNLTQPKNHYVKLALNIVNTSTVRGLAEHTIANAPVISDWLYQLVAEDAYLAENLNTLVLREVKAISFSSGVEAIASGKIACLWRESIHSYLRDTEQAIPFSGLTEMDCDARPIITDWVARYGVREWLEQLLKVCTLPLIRLLYAHGVAMESHAQNMILIHKEGWPIRVALKDFHDGVRFIPEQVTHRERLSAIWATPEQHLTTNSSSYICASEPEDVKNYLYSAFFSMSLSEVALFFDLNFRLPESVFWESLVDCIISYQCEFPEQQRQFKLFNLQSEYVIVEAHTKRRLQNESSVRINRVKNPLFIRSVSQPPSSVCEATS